LKKILSLLLLFLFLHTSINAETEKEIFNTGVHLFKQGSYEQAIDEFTKLIELSPNNADAYKNRGVSYMKVEKYDLAIKDFEKAKDIFPELRGLYSNIGVAWYYKKEYEKAIENYDFEINMAPENSVAYFNRALCLSELNKNNEALDDLTKTIEIKPDFYWAMCYKADLLKKLGNTSEAIKTYKQAIEQNSEDTYAKEKLAALQGDLVPTKSFDKKVSAKTDSSNTLTPDAYSLQTGAYLNQNNANKMKDKLIKNGFDSQVLILDGSKERTWYVVRSGKYKTQTEAKKEKSILDQKMGLKSMIRPSGSW
jgi:tetratricopeptide (TPR) repeat protein